MLAVNLAQAVSMSARGLEVRTERLRVAADAVACVFRPAMQAVTTRDTVTQDWLRCSNRLEIRASRDRLSRLLAMLA